jgi:hypothetical protein
LKGLEKSTIQLALANNVLQILKLCKKSNAYQAFKKIADSLGIKLKVRAWIRTQTDLFLGFMRGLLVLYADGRLDKVEGIDVKRAAGEHEEEDAEDAEDGEEEEEDEEAEADSQEKKKQKAREFPWKLHSGCRLSLK